MSKKVEKRLQACITAQELVIEMILAATIKAGLLHPNDLMDHLKTFLAIRKDPRMGLQLSAETKDAVREKMDMIFDCYPLEKNTG